MIRCFVITDSDGKLISDHLYFDIQEAAAAAVAQNLPSPLSILELRPITKPGGRLQPGGWIRLSQRCLDSLGVQNGDPLYLLPNRCSGRYELLTLENVEQIEDQAEADHGT